MNSIFTSCPIAKRTTETFVDFVNVGGERRKVDFKKEIIWIQESESTLRYIHGGKELKQGPTHTDYYGYLSSAGAESLGPHTYAEEYGITQESSLELVVETVVFLRPVYETEETREYNANRRKGGKPQYLDVSGVWRQERVIEGETLYPSLERVEVGCGVTWWSKNTPEQNAMALRAFCEAWKA